MNKEIKQKCSSFRQKTDENIAELDKLFNDLNLAVVKLGFPKNVKFTVKKEVVVKSYLRLVENAQATNNTKLLAYLTEYLEKHPIFKEFVQEPLNKAQALMKQIKNN